MLLSILDLERITVNDIMVPRQEISGLDVSASWEDILNQLRQTPHTRLPVYEGELDNLIGLLHLKRVAHELVRGELTRERLIELARGREAYFVPEGTALNVQLAHFQRNRRRFAFVVNEYGDIEGLVTLEDILEEIIGKFTTTLPSAAPMLVWDTDGSASAEGTMPVREVNRALGLSLPTDGPKTLSGLIVEHLQDLPEGDVSLRIAGVPMEIVHAQGRTVKTVRIFRPAEALESSEASAA
jgi:Mg2+/Co2+ transporter CorB